MNLTTIAATVGAFLSILTAIGLIYSARIYLKSTAVKQGDQIDDDTIKRLNNAIDALKLENESLRNENTLLKETLKVMQSQIDQSKADIQRLTDLATNQTAINDVKSILQKFEFIIPMMAQFQQNDHEIQNGLKEIRDMIRKLPQIKKPE